MRNVIEAGLPTLLAQTTGKLQVSAIGLILKLKLKADAATFAGWVANPQTHPNTRVAALQFLAEANARELGNALLIALRDPSPMLRSAAREIFATLDPKNGSALLTAALADPTATVAERQRAVTTLAQLKTPLAGAALDRLAEDLAAGHIAAELQLDVLDALKAAPTPTRTRFRSQFERTLPKDVIGRFRISLVGGDAERGRDIFFGHTAAQCVRCHTIDGVGGTAGPNLTDVAKRNPQNTRQHLLESLTQPNAKIAPGFAGIAVTTLDGKVIAGTLMADDPNGITVRKPDGQTVQIPVADIDARTTPLSPMPAIDRTLTPHEMRDLIEFLAGLQSTPPAKP